MVIGLSIYPIRDFTMLHTGKNVVPVDHQKRKLGRPYYSPWGIIGNKSLQGWAAGCLFIYGNVDRKSACHWRYLVMELIV